VDVDVDIYVDVVDGDLGADAARRDELIKYFAI